MNDKNYEKMVDKLHDEQIKIHSLLTEKEKIINEKNIQINHLENQLQSWADEATNWVVMADKHAKLITKHNILKELDLLKNVEEIVKKKDQYYNELLKKNEIIKSLNINLNNITKSVADMKKSIIENENKSRALLMELSKKDSILKDMEKKILLMVRRIL
ncbi:hypothetical protein PFNF54_01425 [Plasmodium falciparum NF54]|uniref:Uncharacterized protein n=1 Tax=Plasmodium falciparum (isolate NF54) TaxID=5843 RepID=W7KJY5_PLAFO|nr:hypothetical protein PFNF54_01425 [Plasmodium falciparum NF54]